MRESPRRRVLRTGGTLLAGGLTVGLGGCLQNDVSETPTDDGDGDGGDLPAYADWLPAPAELGTDHYRFLAVDATAFHGRQDALAGTRFESVFGTTAQYANVSFDDVSTAINAGRARVLVGDVSEFRSSLSERAEVTETYHGYTIYDDTVAVTDGTAVLPWETEMGEVDGMKTAIDAKRGAIDRYTGASDDCRTLVDELGDAPLAVGRTLSDGPDFEELVAAGANWSVDENRATLAVPLVFESDAVPTDEIRTVVAERRYFAPARSRTVTATGRVATVEVTFDTDTVDSVIPPYVSGSRQSRVPQVRMSWQYDERGDSGGVVTVQHDGGDNIETGNLVFRGVGFRSADAIPDTSPGELDVTADDSRWPAANTATEMDGEPTVAAGDEVRIGVASDFEMALVWEPEDGDTSATLSEEAGPDA